MSGIAGIAEPATFCFASRNDVPGIVGIAAQCFNAWQELSAFCVPRLTVTKLRRLEKLVGSEPDRSFACRLRVDNAVSLLYALGMLPVKLFPDASSACSVVNPAKAGGSEPLSTRKEMSSPVTAAPGLGAGGVQVTYSHDPSHGSGDSQDERLFCGSVT